MARPPTEAEFAHTLTKLGDFGTAEAFFELNDYIQPPSSLPNRSNLYIFRSGPKPEW